MANQGVNSPGTTENDTAVGSLAWQNSDNVKTSNNVYSSTGYSSERNYQYSNYLRATNFGFTIPSGAAIDGIVVGFERKAGGDDLDSIYDSSIKIVKSDGSIGSTDKASATKWTTDENYFTYGSSVDLWGETWENTDINNTNFGIVLSIKGKSLYGEGYWIGYVDHICMTVYYTEGAGEEVTKKFLFKKM